MSQLFAVVKWLQVHPHRHIMGKPVEVWRDNLYEDKSQNKVIPVVNITSRVAVSSDSLDGHDKIIILKQFLYSVY